MFSGSNLSELGSQLHPALCASLEWNSRIAESGEESSRDENSSWEN